jgi:DNA-binding PadR family transcriptional regulator
LILIFSSLKYGSSAVSRAIKLRDLVVLGLLREHPRYGYEIKMIIDHVMSHVIDVSSGSLYYGLKKLEERNLVEESAIEKVGRRPERSVLDHGGRQRLPGG